MDDKSPPTAYDRHPFAPEACVGHQYCHSVFDSTCSIYRGPRDSSYIRLARMLYELGVPNHAQKEGADAVAIIVLDVKFIFTRVDGQFLKVEKTSSETSQDTQKVGS